MANPYNTSMRTAAEIDTYNVVQLHYDGGNLDIIVDSDLVDCHDMILWLIHNCKGKFKPNNNNFYFELESDAIAFKLNFV